MKLSEILERESNNETGSAFLYVDGDVLKAYEFSAYLLSCFCPEFDLCEEKDTENDCFIIMGATDTDFLLRHKEFEILVHDEYVEMTLPMLMPYLGSASQ